MEAWKEKNEEMKVKLEEKKRGFWREFVAGLREGEDGKKVWRTIKCLSAGRCADQGNEILVVEGKEARTDKQKASRFASSYAKVNKVKIGVAERARRKKVNIRLQGYREGGEYDREFVMSELESALEQMSEGKKGGVDGVETYFLKNMPEETKGMWLEVFNES